MKKEENILIETAFNVTKRAILLMVLLLPMGFAEANSLDQNTTSVTAVSGYPGVSADTELAIFSDGKGITEIAWEELLDNPCYFWLTGKDPGNGSDVNNRVSSECGGNSRVDSRKTVKFKDNPRYFVRGIAVCTNNKKNHRLKGIKIYAAKLPPNTGNVIDLTVTNQKSRAHCKNWHTPVYCPEDKVANGLEIRRNDGSAVGLALHCQRRAKG